MSTLPELRGDLRRVLDAGYPCIGLVGFEEELALELVGEAGEQAGRQVYVWSMTTGWTFQGRGVELKSDTYTLKEEDGSPSTSTKLIPALQEVLDDGRGRRLVLVLKDLPAFFDEPKVVRKLLDVLGAGEVWTLAFAAPSVQLPAALEKEVTLLEVPLPDEAELRKVLERNLVAVANQRGAPVRLSGRLARGVVRAALGLTRKQANFVFRRALSGDGEFGEENLAPIAEQKRQMIATSGILEYVEPEASLAGIGGLDVLKEWLVHRRGALSERAREYGLPEPRGVLLLGVQGCGKSLVSKAVAGLWHMPLLRLDVGSLFSSYIGRSEENLRKALRVAESIAPVVLWLDEIDKGFAGVSGSGSADAGTSARVFGTFLTWMQERRRPVFVVATANAIEHLPAELLRKGRFDEIFFVDLPTRRERVDILRIHLRRVRRDPAQYAVQALADASEGYSGAELEQAVVDAMYRAFPEEREFTTEDVLAALRETCPLSQTLAETIGSLRAWASSRARWATTPDSE